MIQVTVTLKQPIEKALHNLLLVTRQQHIIITNVSQPLRLTVQGSI